MHIAIIGAGRVGRPIAYLTIYEGLADELSIVDVKPGLADAFAEELKHIAVDLNEEVEINSYETSEEVSGADIIIISAGFPRIPRVKMTRRDLVRKNSKIIKEIAETLPSRNKGAKYIVVTNPVDAMATLFRKISREDFVISSGTHIDSLRLRAKISTELNVPATKVEGFVGGEHGEDAVILWSTIKVDDMKIDEYLRQCNKKLDKREVEKYVKEISKHIVDVIGGTEIGPAVACKDIIKAITLDENRLISVSIPMKFNNLLEEVHVSVPVELGSLIKRNLYQNLVEEERRKIEKSALKIFETYKKALEQIFPH